MMGVMNAGEKSIGLADAAMVEVFFPDVTLHINWGSVINDALPNDCGIVERSIRDLATDITGELASSLDFMIQSGICASDIMPLNMKASINNPKTSPQE